MATITNATVENTFGETIPEADLVFTDDDRARMGAELAEIPALKALLAASRPAARPAA